MFYRIERIKANGKNYDVLLKDGTWFDIKRPDFSDIKDTIRFQIELLEKGIHPVEVEYIMFKLIVGMLLTPKTEVYHWA